LEYTGLDDAKVFIYSNKSGADNRLQFLSDPTVAAAEINGSVDTQTRRNYPLMRTVGHNERSLNGIQALHAGANEFLLRVIGSGTARLKLTLTWEADGTSDNNIPIDSSIITMKDAKEFYSVVSARG